jgi:hypothetical protein
VKFTVANACWALAYIAVIVAVVAAMLQVRRQAIATFGGPQAQAEWDQWREDAKKMASSDGPVKRREPKSAEPPALVLMRDHFAVCLGLSLVLTSVLFGTFMIFVRGALATAPSPPAQRP